MNETIVTKVEVFGPCACTGEVWLNIDGWPVLINRETAEILGLEHGDDVEIIVRKSQKNIEKVRK